MIFATSCSIDDTVPSNEGETSLSEFDTSTTTSYSIGYDFNTNNFNVAFEDVYDFCCEITDTDLNEFSRSDYGTNVHMVDQGDYDIQYINNYRAYLNYESRPDPETGEIWYFPEDYEYHITRCISFNNSFYFYEFDDGYWAEVNFSRALDQGYEYNGIINETLYPNGYCFMDYGLSSMRRMFYSYYVSGNCIMIYRYDFVNGRDNTDYEVYLALCDQFGLPTCPEITEEIMGS